MLALKTMTENLILVVGLLSVEVLTLPTEWTNAVKEVEWWNYNRTVGMSFTGEGCEL